MHFVGGAWLRPYRPESQEFIHHTYIHRKHGYGLSQVLCILWAEHGSAPTDLSRKNLYIIHIYIASMVMVYRKCYAFCGRSI